MASWRAGIGHRPTQPRRHAPLCSAARHHGLAEVTALLDNGADPTVMSRDPDDPSIEGDPLACALTNSRPWSEVLQIIEVLEAAGSASPAASETTAEVLPGAHPLVMAYAIIVSHIVSPLFGGMRFYTPPDALDDAPVLPPEPAHLGPAPYAFAVPALAGHPVMLAVAPMGSPQPIGPPIPRQPPPPTLPPRTVVGASREGSSDFRGAPSTPTARLTTRSGQPIAFAVNEIDHSRPPDEKYRLAAKPHEVHLLPMPPTAERSVATSLLSRRCRFRALELVVEFLEGRE